MQKSKSILFISALDFKEKSIQVIRKTPEAYVENGWEVHYVVARDNSKYGNYFYEDKFNLKGVEISRISYPLSKMINKLPRFFYRFLRPIDNYLLIFLLAIKASIHLKKETFDIIYGYEVHGFLASKVLSFLGFLKKSKIVARFQGTFYISPLLFAKKYIRLIPKWDYLLALYLKSDLCIMTNDGTQGDKVLEHIKSKHQKKLKFWVNGVDKPILNKESILKIKGELKLRSENIFISVSRLEKIKRVDLGIKIIHHLVYTLGHSNLKYIIVGEGTQMEDLKQLSIRLKLNNYITFVGAVKQIEVMSYLELSQFFISTFESSNVGNPLLEAIRAHKIVVTINNGDTASWIDNGHNGIINNFTESFVEKTAKDILNLIKDVQQQELIIKNIKITEQEKLWTWEERMNAEINEVSKLL